MRITLLAFGSRGDVQPCIPLAKGLEANGHAVTFVAGSNFEGLAQAHDLNFVGAVDTEAVMQSPEGLAWVEESNPYKQLRYVKRAFDLNAREIANLIAETAQGADLILSGFLTLPMAQAVSEKTGVSLIDATLQPYSPTRSGAASLNALLPRRDSILNLWVGQMSEAMIWIVAREKTNEFRRSLGLPEHSIGSYNRANSRRTDTLRLQSARRPATERLARQRPRDRLLVLGRTRLAVAGRPRSLSRRRCAAGLRRFRQYAQPRSAEDV